MELRDTIGSGTNFPRELAKAGGGRVWSAKSPGALRELFGQVLDELRARYLITYYPTGVAREGWHDVRLRLKDARGDITAGRHRSTSGLGKSKPRGVTPRTSNRLPSSVIARPTMCGSDANRCCHSRWLIIVTR